MKILTAQTDLTSYTPSTIKLLVCLVVLTSLYYRGFIYTYLSDNMIYAVNNLAPIIQLLGFVCLMNTIVEFVDTYRNRKQLKKNNRVKQKKSKNTSKSRMLSIDDIVSLVVKNDIIEIELLMGENTILIGASSDCNKGDCNFFDKRYYIEKNEYDSIVPFIENLNNFDCNGSFEVLHIDGVSPYSYRIK